MSHLALKNIPNVWMQDVGLTGEDLRPLSTATTNLVGVVPVVHRISILDAATANIDNVLTHKTLVTDFRFVKTGGAGAAGNTIELRNGTTNSLGTALDTNVADQAIVRPTVLNDAFWSFEAGATLRVVRTKAGGNAAGILFIEGLRVE